MSYDYIYIIQLEEYKFYIGQANDPEAALFDHKYKDKCEFTSKYRPLGEGGFMMAPFIGSEEDIQQITTNLMLQYGFDNVRNSTKYNKINLTAEEIIAIKKELLLVQKKTSKLPAGSVRPACERCGRLYHCTDQCSVYRDILGKVILEPPSIGQNQAQNDEPEPVAEYEPPAKQLKPAEMAYPYAGANGTLNIQAMKGQVKPKDSDTDSDNEAEDSPSTGNSTTDTDEDYSHDEAYDNEDDKEICVERGILYWICTQAVTFWIFQRHISQRLSSLFFRDNIRCWKKYCQIVPAKSWF